MAAARAADQACEGAFKGTRSRNSYASHQGLQAVSQTSNGSPPPPADPPSLTSHSTTANSTPIASRNATPQPKIAQRLKLKVGTTPPTKRKSALKDASAPTPKRQKHVRLLDIPDIQIVNADVPEQIPISETTSQRAPSIKLSFSKPKTPAPAATPVSKKPKTPLTNGHTPSSAKKRKRSQDPESSEDELAQRRRPVPTPVRKVTVTLKAPPAPAPVTQPLIRLKAKGKIPKRPLGVGYDSELEDKEQDPVLLDGFILRMMPGEDCDYIQKHIGEGTVGVHRQQGGADIQIKVFDVQGRRGILTVRQQKYAIAMVDLPCIVEGMKSWDKKGWIKSIDVCQMMLVLGKCKTDEEAKKYQLPAEVDPTTFQYANGLTPPMKDVRRRRFARTKRARIDDIESVERKVQQLLQADAGAEQVSYRVFDHDPRIDQHMESASGTEEYSGTEEDAEGEEDGEAEENYEVGIPDNYFARQTGAYGQVTETPVYADSPAEAIGDDELAELEAAFAEGEDEDEVQTNGHDIHPSRTLQPPEGGGSSFAVTSTSASPSATAAHTPASVADVGQASEDDEEDDEDPNTNVQDSLDEEESDEDEDEAEKEEDENLQRVKDQIDELIAKIREQEELFKINPNSIIRRKIRTKIEALQGDVAMKKRTIGLSGEDGDGDGE